MDAGQNKEREKPPQVVVVAPSSRPPETPFADPATGTPIQGKPSQGQSSPSELRTGAAKLLDPEDLEDIYERQESRLPDLVEGTGSNDAEVSTST